MGRMSKSALITGIVIVIAVLVAGYFFFYMNNQNPLSSSPASSVPPTGTPSASDNSVVIQDIKVGTGATAASGQTVKVNYIGKLQSGTVFDQSSNHGGPFSFTLGAGQVIPGWEQGIQGMKV